MIVSYQLKYTSAHAVCHAKNRKVPSMRNYNNNALPIP
jgi:hypothetical protein